MTILGTTFNYADLAIVLIFLIAAIVGYCRGIIINIVNFIRLSVGTFLCFFTAENASQPVYERWVKPKLLEAVTEAVSSAANTEEMTANLNTYLEKLPKFIADNIHLEGIDVSAENVAESIVTSVFEPVVLTAVKIALFLAVLVAFFGFTWVVLHIVKRHNKKREAQRGHQSVLRRTDKWLGLLFGILKAAVIVLAISAALLYILQLKPALAEDSNFWSQVSDSSLIAIIKEMNPFNAITEGYI